MNSRRFLAYPSVAASTLVVCMLAGCMANPGPPPVVENPQEEATTTTPAPAAQDPDVNPDGTPKRTTISVGVDPLRAGLNPHLVANSSELVSQIAALVLPSAFVDGQLNTDLLDSAELIEAPEGVAQRVEYKISSAAQWSDGTPLTGADFEYLWRNMVTTAGVVDPAGYHAISAITSSDGGRIVTVDFTTQVKDWQELFANLLPSHLLQIDENSFVQGMASGIPASAGRYLLNNVDLARGIITLNRNDRFWGASPAKTDVLQLRTIRNTAQAVDMLRSGQVGFADFTPEQTSEESLSLLPQVQTESVPRARQLRMHLSTADEALDQRELRAQLASVIDTAQVARLATGRTEDLRVGVNPVPPLGEGQRTDLVALRARAQVTPIRIAVDPTDSVALTAASTISDVLTRQRIPSTVVRERMTTITSNLLPQGQIDAVLTWEDTTVDAFSMANMFLCSAPQEAAERAAEQAAGETTSGPAPTTGVGAGTAGQSTAASASAEPTSTTIPPVPAPEDVPLAGDLSSYCPAQAESTFRGLLSGRISPGEGLEQVRELNREHVLYIPLMDETRVHALGRGIVGPSNFVKDWGSGIATAAEWEIEQ